MSISMYQASVPVFIRMLGSLRRQLQKAEAHCTAAKIDPAVLLNSRLFPNMFPLIRQSQVACDFAKGTAARLAGSEPPKYEDNETTFAQLYARIDSVVGYVTGIKAAQIDGSETREISFPAGGQTLRFTGLSYLVDFALPNFYFHLTTAYAILRHNGVEVGKQDFIALN
jgi:uncharacterized protein